MKFRIGFCFKGKDGEEHEDSIVLQGDTVEEIRVAVDKELAARGGYDPWSEEINP